LLVTYKGSLLNYAHAKPEHLDMGIPTKWRTLKEIMQAYPYKCARISNANYFGAVIQGEAKDSGGAMAQGQIVNGRPAVYVRGSRAWYSYDHLDVYEADVAVGAGPMLVVDGVIGDLEGRIRHGSFSGLRQTNKCERCAIGYTSDGLLLHVVAQSLTLYELAQFFIEKGCVWAMNLDGGSSVGLLEGDGASFNTAKRIPSALVIREVVEEVSEVVRKSAFKQLSKNFNEHEFDCPHCGMVLGPAPKLLNLLQRMRDIIKFPLIVHSAYRCTVHNAEVGGAPGSYHLKGMAADISCRNVNSSELFKLAEQLGFGGIHDYGGWIHVDVGPSRRW
jgi:hypothetical protein